MLSPEEKIKLEELKNKQKDYIPMTTKELSNATNQCAKVFKEFTGVTLFGSEFWHKICETMQTLGKMNIRLIQEVEYLKDQLNNKN